MKNKFLNIFIIALMVIFSSSLTTLAASNYKDGLYVAKSDTPSHNWISVVELTIKNGEIYKVEAENYNDKMMRRTSDTVGNSYMKKQYGFDFNDVVNNFTSKLLTNKKLSDVDAIAGATLSNDIFKMLSEQALKDAEVGNTQQSIIHK